MDFSTRLLSGVLLMSLLAGCNDNSNTVTSAPAQLTVQPALGQVFNATVELLDKNGVTIQQQKLASNGKATFTLPEQLPSPYVVRVCGGSGVNYFDEALQQSVSLPIGVCLRALSPSRQTKSLTISTLSEAVVRYFEQHGGLNAVTTASLQMQYADFAAKLALSPDIELMPTQIGSNTILQALIGRHTGANGQQIAAVDETVTVDADQYAYRLAALAQSAKILAAHRGLIADTPAIAIADVLAADMAADGKLDGRDANGYIVSPVYDALQLNTLLAQVQRLQLKEHLGEGFQDQDLSTQAGRDYLQAHHLRLPPVLPVEHATPDDVLLSWQGHYNGKWHLGGNINSGKQFASFLPVVYQSYMSQLIEGDPCVIDVTDELILVNGLSFKINPSVRVSSDALGQRLYSLQRDDAGGLVSVHAVGGLDTLNGAVKAARFDVTATVLFTALDAQVACEVGN